MVKIFTITFFVISLVVISNAFKIEPKIVRGYTARAGQFPYYALLDIKSYIWNPRGNFIGPRTSVVQSRCGATLISDQWLVTAAHCLDGAGELNVHLGISQTWRQESQHKVFHVGRENFHLPAVYKKTPVWIDMALIHLPEPVQFSEYIKPVHMPTKCDKTENKVSYALGFGRTSDKGSYSNVLQYAVLRTLPADICQRVFPSPQSRDWVTCAYDKMNYQSICKGDSGGPLVSSVDGTLIGVSSFGRADFGCEKGVPQAFANALPYLKWIEKLTGLELPECA